MIDSSPVLDSFSLVAPLGVRFWDEISNSVVGDGLVITAYPLTNPEHRVQAFTSPSGVYVLRDLPGLRAIENGPGDAAFWANLPSKRPFAIEVQDQYRRFQPFLLTADLPVRGLLTWECGATESLPSPVSMVPLFSSPARPVPSEMAVLRADLWDQEADAPAAWAVLEAHIPGQPPVRGFADDAGRIVLIFPYPEPIDFVFGDLISPPPGTAGLPLTQHEWTIQLQATYTHLHPVPLIPELCTTLTQPVAHLWVDAANKHPLTEVTLRFGQELVVRSYDFGTGTQLPVLYITPTASSPF